jgi:predicted amidohydrolase YtcJ
VIAHVQLVDDADLERFAALGVIPCMQPLWAQQDALMTVLTVPRLGRERADKQYRMRSLADSGAPLALGSDWPVSSGAPLDGIAVGVSRQTAEGDPAGGWTPEEILTIERALSAYTAGVAEQAFAEEVWGRLVPGASADLLWLDRDPRETPALELPTIGIRGTYVRGKLGHQSDKGIEEVANDR